MSRVFTASMAVTSHAVNYLCKIFDIRNSLDNSLGFPHPFFEKAHCTKARYDIIATGDPRVPYRTNDEANGRLYVITVDKGLLEKPDLFLYMVHRAIPDATGVLVQIPKASFSPNVLASDVFGLEIEKDFNQRFIASKRSKSQAFSLIQPDKEYDSGPRYKKVYDFFKDAEKRLEFSSPDFDIKDWATLHDLKTCDSVEELENLKEIYPEGIRHSFASYMNPTKFYFKLMAGLLDILTLARDAILGVTSPYVYGGMRGNAFPLHEEDGNTGSLNYMYEVEGLVGQGSKIWVVFNRNDRSALINLVKREMGPKRKARDLTKKVYIQDLFKLAQSGIRFQILRQTPGDLIVTHGFHCGVNTGNCVNEAWNFAHIQWLGFNPEEDKMDKSLIKTKKNISPIQTGQNFGVEEFPRRAHPLYNEDWKQLKTYVISQLLESEFDEKLSDCKEFVDKDPTQRRAFFKSLIHVYCVENDKSFDRGFFLKVYKAMGYMTKKEIKDSQKEPEDKTIEWTSIEKDIHHVKVADGKEPSEFADKMTMYFNILEPYTTIKIRLEELAAVEEKNPCKLHGKDLTEKLVNLYKTTWDQITHTEFDTVYLSEDLPIDGNDPSYPEEDSTPSGSHTSFSTMGGSTTSMLSEEGNEEESGEDSFRGMDQSELDVTNQSVREDSENGPENQFQFIANADNEGWSRLPIPLFSGDLNEYDPNRPDPIASPQSGMHSPSSQSPSQSGDQQAQSGDQQASDPLTQIKEGSEIPPVLSPIQDAGRVEFDIPPILSVQNEVQQEVELNSQTREELQLPSPLLHPIQSGEPSTQLQSELGAPPPTVQSGDQQELNTRASPPLPIQNEVAVAQTIGELQSQAPPSSQNQSTIRNIDRIRSAFTPIYICQPGYQPLNMDLIRVDWIRILEHLAEHYQIVQNSLPQLSEQSRQIVQRGFLPIQPVPYAKDLERGTNSDYEVVQSICRTPPPGWVPPTIPVMPNSQGMQPSQSQGSTGLPIASTSSSISLPSTSGATKAKILVPASGKITTDAERKGIVVPQGGSQARDLLKEIEKNLLTKQKPPGSRPLLNTLTQKFVPAINAHYAAVPPLSCPKPTLHSSSGLYYNFNNGVTRWIFDSAHLSETLFKMLLKISAEIPPDSETSSKWADLFSGAEVNMKKAWKALLEDEGIDAPTATDLASSVVSGITSGIKNSRAKFTGARYKRLGYAVQHTIITACDALGKERPITPNSTHKEWAIKDKIVPEGMNYDEWILTKMDGFQVPEELSTLYPGVQLDENFSDNVEWLSNNWGLNYGMFFDRVYLMNEGEASNFDTLLRFTKWENGERQILKAKRKARQTKDDEEEEEEEEEEVGKPKKKRLHIEDEGDEDKEED